MNMQRKRMLGAWVVVVGGLLAGQAASRAADEPKAVVAKGIEALGGEAKLKQVKAMKWRSVGKVSIEGNENPFTVDYVTQGLDHLRTNVQGEFNGNEIRMTTVLDGKKGWRTFPEVNELDADGVDNEKRTLYLMVVPATLVPLLGKEFKVEAAGDEQVDGKPARAVKVTGPDGKTFRLMFDQATGLPVRTVATVVGFGGDDYEQTVTLKDYQEIQGIKKATKYDVLRNGDPFLSATIKDFATMDAAPANSFAEPK